MCVCLLQLYLLHAAFAKLSCRSILHGRKPCWSACMEGGFLALVSWSLENSAEICPRRTRSSSFLVNSLHYILTLIVISGEQSVARLALVAFASTTSRNAVRSPTLSAYHKYTIAAIFITNFGYFNYLSIPRSWSWVRGGGVL